MAHTPAHDAAQDIAAPFIRWQHAIGDKKGGGAQMIGDDAMAELGLALAPDAADLFRGGDQVAEKIDIVIVGDALQDGGDALQPHAGVDGGLGQVETGFLVHLLELHEDQVPEFQEAVAILVGAAVRAARDRRTLVVEDFRAEAAGTGGAHGPEIALMADDSAVRKPGDLLPELTRLLVGVVDRDQQLVRRQAHHLGNEIPGVEDGLFLEVIAEGEVAQHLEERVVPGGVADIVEIVVLAAGANAFLHTGGPGVVALFRPGEEILELHHARVGEKQGGIVARHQG